MSQKKSVRTPVFLRIDPSKRLKQTLGGLLLLRLLLILQDFEKTSKKVTKKRSELFFSFCAPKTGVVTGTIFGLRLGG